MISPVPITAVGFDVSAGWPFVGMAVLHEPFGLPAPPIDDEPPLPPPPSGDCDEPELQPIQISATGTIRAAEIRMRHLDSIIDRFRRARAPPSAAT